ncbi:membrane or secreted protein [Candidatus Omnitrophus magneticus]|uniref:Membrane or secreted protein n=1 Tax=Candidatus Omnitrophus magneticus TaxID=1609969 RepID=A0A0F0CJ60_9BACT|nr:membrane or secreted protein [Candidatus Omnitrophus magneticus]
MLKTKKIYITIIILSLIASGCASYKPGLSSMWGADYNELSKVKRDGVTKEINMPIDKTFDEVLKIAGENKLTVFKKDSKKKFLILIGFPKQTNTTRVGVFFEPINNSSTIITLSSLSSATLVKAKKIIFENIKPEK